jgi:hypothetical protein
MGKPRPQFSIAALLLTVAAVAVVLALMVQVNGVAFLALLLALMPLLTIGLIYGQGNLRPFCIGAIFPVGFFLAYAAFRFEIHAFRRSASSFFWTAILMSIALGYLCVWFRWLIDRPRPPESRPEGR